MYTLWKHFPIESLTPWVFDDTDRVIHEKIKNMMRGGRKTVGDMLPPMLRPQYPFKLDPETQDRVRFLIKSCEHLNRDPRKSPTDQDLYLPEIWTGPPVVGGEINAAECSRKIDELFSICNEGIAVEVVSVELEKHIRYYTLYKRIAELSALLLVSQPPTFEKAISDTVSRLQTEVTRLEITFMEEKTNALLAMATDATWRLFPGNMG